MVRLVINPCHASRRGTPLGRPRSLRMPARSLFFPKVCQTKVMGQRPTGSKDNMRSSKSRSRSKPNRPRTLGNIINRVFDSSGPDGKVRGTPAQLIEKYQFLARDAQLSNDRVAAENFLQHAEHYTRLLAEANREMAAEQETRATYSQPGQGGQAGQGGQGGQGGQTNQTGNRPQNGERADYRGEYSRDYRDDRGDEQPDLVRHDLVRHDLIGDEDAGLVETPEAAVRHDQRNDRPNDPRNDRPNDPRPRYDDNRRNQPQRGQDGQRTDSQRPDSQRSDGQRTDSQRTDSQRNDGQRTDSQRTDSQRNDGQRTDGQRTDGQRSDGNRSNEQRRPYPPRVDQNRGDQPRQDRPYQDRSQPDRSQQDRSQQDRSQQDRSQPDRKPDQPRGEQRAELKSVEATASEPVFVPAKPDQPSYLAPQPSVVPAVDAPVGVTSPGTTPPSATPPAATKPAAAKPAKPAKLASPVEGEAVAPVKKPRAVSLTPRTRTPKTPAETALKAPSDEPASD